MCTFGEILNKANLNNQINCLCKEVAFRVHNHIFDFEILEVNYYYKRVWLYCGSCRRFDATKHKNHHSTKMKLVRRQFRKVLKIK